MYLNYIYSYSLLPTLSAPDLYHLPEHVANIPLKKNNPLIPISAAHDVESATRA